MVAIINTSPIAWGIASLMSSLGGRFVVSSLTPMQERILGHPLTRRLVICCMVFAGTRDLIKSIIITFGVILVLDVLANETSRFRIIPLPRPLKHVRSVVNSMGGDNGIHVS